MSKVWLIIKEEDFFYDDKYYDYYVFDTEESARKFYDDYVEIMLYELEKDYGEQDESFMDAIEIDKFSNGKGTRIFLDDAYYITLQIEEKEVMSVG